MKTLIVSSRKGGVGKTTTAVNLAAAYAQGARTLIIDLDVQGDASNWLGIDESGEALAAALAADEIELPGPASMGRALIDDWYGRSAQK